MKDTAKKRLTIGLITDWAEDPYHSTLRTGIADAAEKNDVNLICFVTGRINPDADSYEAQQNILFDFVNKKNVDGLIIISGSVGHWIGARELNEHFQRYKSMPMVSIALPIAGTSSVLVDNVKGIRDLLVHLIKDHGYRKLAFIKGPEQNLEAEQRFLVYREVLEDYKISFDPRLIVQGDFLTKTGAAAVRVLLDERNMTPEAIIAANDEMACGAIMELKRRGITVPQKMAVAGFDNMEMDNFTFPTLTTVQQPLYKQAMLSVDLLMGQIQNNSETQNLLLPTELVIRESCGCLSMQQDKTERNPEAPAKTDLPGLVKTGMDEFSRQLLDSMDSFIDYEKSSIGEQWAEILIQAFFTDLSDRKANRFTNALNEIIYKTINSMSSPTFWHEMINRIRSIVYDHISDADFLTRAENLLHQARTMICEITRRNEIFKKLEMSTEASRLRNLGEELLERIEIDPLLDEVAKELPRIGVKSSYLSMYKNPESPLENSKLILAFNEDGRLDIDLNKNIFPSKNLFPDSSEFKKRRFTAIVETLFYGKQPLGLAIFEMASRNWKIYEALRFVMINSLRSSLLLKQLQDQANRLEEEVKARTKDLTKINTKLEREIRERKRTEEDLTRSNADLEQFAYIASHDLQEPLRMVSSYVQLLERRLKNSLDKDSGEFMDFIVDGAKRMQTMISDLLTYSRVTTNQKQFISTDCNQLLEKVVTNIQTMVAETKAKITYSCPITVNADPSQLTQIFQNLIANAVKFHSEKEPRVEIKGEDKNGEWIFSVKDNGIGIDEKFKNKIFVMFQRLHTRNEYPGTGIGLAICKKIIERHKGRIWIDSKPGKGSTFYFTIPKTQEKQNDRLQS
ncbi:MAG: substrate-binding domain-containing protein [Spirochaetales bacterium]|nr:substrate-binding domain-containing protein [Spirochaetales bacterium]